MMADARNRKFERVSKLLDEFNEKDIPEHDKLHRLQAIEANLTVAMERGSAWSKPVSLLPAGEPDRKRLITSLISAHRRRVGNSSWKPSCLQLALMMAMPLQNLKDAFKVVPTDIIHVMIKHIVHRPVSDNAEQGLFAPDSSSQPDSLAFTQCASEAAFFRDGAKCIFTESLEPDVYHIMPSSVNSTPNELEKTILGRDIMSHVLDKADCQAICDLLASSVGCSDEPWNMLTLSPALYRAWRSMKCGFVYMGTTKRLSSPDVNVNIQLRWFNPRLNDPETLSTRRIDVDQRDFELDLLHCIPEGAGGANRTELDGGWDDEAVVDASGHALKSGRLAVITMSAEDAYRMRIMLQLQWAWLKIKYFARCAC